MFMCILLCFQKKLPLMDEPSGPSSPRDAHGLPDWANWPLRSDGKLDAERLMPTTFRVCSKEYCRSRQDLAKSLPTLAPKRGDKHETKSIPIISNLTLLELYDLSGEEIIEFRSFVLETLGEVDRINNRERLMFDHGAIKRSMTELRRVANEIHDKKSRAQSTAFLSKPANLAILGYFTRRDPRNQLVSLIPDPVYRPFNKFLSGNKGSARVSVYNWRYKKWDESINRNLSIRQSDGMVSRSVVPVRRVVPANANTPLQPHIDPPFQPHNDATQSDTVDSSGETHESSPTASPSMPAETSPSGAKKMKMDDGFNVEDAIVNGREELNFYCAVKANKVNPEGFGIPKGFVKCGDKIVHHTKTGKVDMSGTKRKRSSKKKGDTKRIKEEVVKEAVVTTVESDEKCVSPAKEIEDRDIVKLNELNGSEVVMDDIEDDDEFPTDEEIEIDVCDGKPLVFTTESSSQTDDNEDIMRTANGDTVINPEIASQLKILESIHSEDMGIIQKLRVENALAVKNLSKYHNKYVSLMMDRNNIKCSYNAIDKERKAEKMQNMHMTKTMKQLTQHNAILLDEVNALKRELAMRDQLERSNGEVGRYEEFSG